MSDKATLVYFELAVLEVKIFDARQSKTIKHTQEIDMRKFALLLVLTSFLSACAGSSIYHESLMRGQVVGIDDKEIVVCIGSDADVVVGKMLQVYRYDWEGSIIEGGDNYSVEKVGEVRIKQRVNEHFARAVITSGDVQKHDVLKLDGK